MMFLSFCFPIVSFQQKVTIVTINQFPISYLHSYTDIFRNVPQAFSHCRLSFSINQLKEMITMQVFSFSLLGAYHLRHICLNYLSTCTWEENKSFLHSIAQKHVHVSALSEAAEKSHHRFKLNSSNFQVLVIKEKETFHMHYTKII